MKLKLIEKLLFEAFEKKEENKYRNMWLAIYPRMSKDNFISFDDFYNKRYEQIDTPTNEILKETEDIRKRFKEAEEKRGENNG